MMEWIRFIASYPTWVGIFVVIWLTIGASVLILAAPRKVDGAKTAESNSPSQQNFNAMNQQNAGVINNVFQGIPPPTSFDARALEALLELVSKQRNEAETRGEHIELLSQIVMKWSELQQSITRREQSTGLTDPAAYRAVDNQIRETLTALLGNVEARATRQGNALIIKTGPNAFRLLYAVVMRVTPNIIFPNLPAGVTANILESSAVGFSVMFTPSTIAIERLPTVIASAEL
jgi:hypothetical protein